jgi:hypothetical protein
MTKVRDVLSRRAAGSICGREEEVADLLETFDRKAPLVVHLHGIAGIGKTSLLEVFTDRARKRRIPVIRIDCRLSEPTERGFLQQLSIALGRKPLALVKVARQLSRLSRRVVLALDNYEVFRLMDTWLRQVFMPAQGDNVRLLLVGRESPSPAWVVAHEWGGSFQARCLEPLRTRDAVKFLRDAGLREQDAVRINRFARGHPLALRLAASAERERPGLELREETARGVVTKLAHIYLDDIDDPVVKRALEAVSVVRRITRSMLRVMVRDSPADLFERLRAIPLVESRPDGLTLHDAVRGSIAAALRAADPSAYRDHCRAAWRQLRHELRTARAAELWRYTADLIYLIENPVIREAFFPSESQRFAVEPAIAGDEAHIRQIAMRHEGEQARKALGLWWETQPSAFSVARDGGDKVAGFYCMFDPRGIDDSVLARDPVASRWSRHVGSSRMASTEKVLFLRRWLSLEEGELPSPVQAACWLDIKRTYMELRPNLRRVYLTVHDFPSYAPVALRLGFKLLEECNVTFDGKTYHTAMLDLGPSSVDGWIGGLVGAELNVEDVGILDADARALVQDGVRVDLTSLEFQVLRYLMQSEGKAISRDRLLDDVWGRTYHGGSNVVDVVVRSLRRKMGARSAVIETVRGVGYRFRSL